MAEDMHGRGVCMAGGVCGRGHALQGHAWQGACIAGGMCGRWVCMARGACITGGACMAGGHAWQGACVAGGMHGRGHECTHAPWQILRAGGTHPTGKHSCKIFFLLIVKEWTAFHNWPSRNPSRSDCECP